MLSHSSLSFCISKSSYQYLESTKDKFLHPKEILLYQEFKYQKRRESFLQGRYAIKKVLSSYFNRREDQFWVFNNVSGVPIVADEPSNISISHSKEYAAAIVSPHHVPVGIDIECYRNLSDISNKILSVEEEKILSISLPNVDANIIRILVWTAKEALVKLLGIGLTVPLRFLEISDVVDLSSMKSSYLDKGKNSKDYCSESKDHCVSLLKDGSNLPKKPVSIVETTASYNAKIIYFKNFPSLRCISFYDNEKALSICIPVGIDLKIDNDLSADILKSINFCKVWNIQII